MSLPRVPSSSFIALATLVALAAAPPARAQDHPRALAAAPPARQLNPLDQPMAVAWPAVSTWSDAMEREYGEFVHRLGEAVSQHRCRRLDSCLRDPTANTLYDAANDAHLTLDVDCADLPYILRAYFSFKRRLPFGFVASVGGRGHDPRYMTRIRPNGFRTWRGFRTPRALLHDIGDMVHSGMYRAAPQIEDADFYTVAINRHAVRPGSIFYDPNGHVLTVTDVRPDGMVYLMDGHPDGSLTWKRFGQAFVVGTASLGGGFKNFRPQAFHEGHIVRAANRTLSGYDPRVQFDPHAFLVNNQPVTYHQWVRATLAEANSAVDPATEFREQVRALCRDVQDRAEAVDAALAAGTQNQPHPPALPENIYGTDGDWELYSTPSRDARLKASFRELRETVSGFLATNAALGPALHQAWAEETGRPECQFGYANSAGARVTLTMDAVLDRLWALSFDPYNCPELRWGAAPGSPELSSCHDDATKQDWYRNEQRLRNRIDREYGRPTALDFGPEASPDVDARRLFNAPPPAPAMASAPPQ